MFCDPPHSGPGGNLRSRPGLIPVGREVDEVANAVLLLGGNGYITGQTISVKGGWYTT